MDEQPTTPQTENSTLAIVSLVAGIAGWTLVPFFGALIAIVTGHLARLEIKSRPDEIGGKGLVTTGLVLGYGCLGTVVVLVLLALAFFLRSADIFN